MTISQKLEELRQQRDKLNDKIALLEELLCEEGVEIPLNITPSKKESPKDQAKELPKIQNNPFGKGKITSSVDEDGRKTIIEEEEI